MPDCGRSRIGESRVSTDSDADDDRVDARLSAVENTVEQMDTRLGEVHNRIGRLDDRMVSRFDQLDGKIDDRFETVDPLPEAGPPDDGDVTLDELRDIAGGRE